MLNRKTGTHFHLAKKTIILLGAKLKHRFKNIVVYYLHVGCLIFLKKISNVFCAFTPLVLKIFIFLSVSFYLKKI